MTLPDYLSHLEQLEAGILNSKEIIGSTFMSRRFGKTTVTKLCECREAIPKLVKMVRYLDGVCRVLQRDVPDFDLGPVYKECERILND